MCVAFLLFKFEGKYYALKSKSPYFFLNKNINFNKNETESQMENPTHKFKKPLNFSKRNICSNISVYSVLNKLLEYKYFYISKNITSYTFLLVFEIVESL